MERMFDTRTIFYFVLKEKEMGKLIFTTPPHILIALSLELPTNSTDNILP